MVDRWSGSCASSMHPMQWLFWGLHGLLETRITGIQKSLSFLSFHDVAIHFAICIYIYTCIYVYIYNIPIIVWYIPLQSDWNLWLESHELLIKTPYVLHPNSSRSQLEGTWRPKRGQRWAATPEIRLNRLVKKAQWMMLVYFWDSTATWGFINTYCTVDGDCIYVIIFPLCISACFLGTSSNKNH